MNIFATKTLDDIGEWGSGGTPLASKPEYYGGSIPWLIIEDLNDGIVNTSQKTITEVGLKNSSAKLVEAGTLLIAMYGSIGKLGIANIRCATNQAIAFCKCNPEIVSVKYLFYYLMYSRPQLTGEGKGGTQQNISQTILKSFLIPLPPIAEQKRIAAICTKADRLRRTRRYALELSDTYLRSVFLEMFGDPVTNSKGFECYELMKLASVERGKFTPRPRNDPSYYGGHYPFIQTGDISNSDGHLNKWTQTLNERGKQVSRSFPPKTIVVAIVGATIGATALLDIEVYCPDSVIGIQVYRHKVTPEFIEFLLRFWRPIFVAQAPETARANINLDTFKPLRTIVPSLPLQEKFAAIVQKSDRIRTQQREALRQAEHLFQTVLHRAFSGEL